MKTNTQHGIRLYHWVGIFLLWSVAILAQGANYTKHTVAKGETITQIALKYAVTPFDIYRLNPDSQLGIKEKDVLLVPKSISSKPIEAPKVANPAAAVRVVQAKETWYSISREVGLPVAQLQALNPAHQDLKIGDTIQLAVLAIPQKPKQVVVLPVKSIRKHLVQAKETKFGIAQKYGVTVAELEQLNPTIVASLPEGAELIIPETHTVPTTETAASSVSWSKPLAKPLQTLTFSKSNPAKKLVLLLPFNAAKIQADTLTPLANRLKKDAFLNLTLDFYAGALVAIDSAKTLGINVEVQVLDSEETKTSSSLDALLKTNQFDGASAVIGPFYQQYVDKLATALATKGTPVLSPLSKELGKLNANGFQTMPGVEQQKSCVLNYMLAQNGTIVVISDPKKVTSKNWISQHGPSVKFAKYLETGALDIPYLKSVLQKSSTNFVVLDTQKTNVILAATAALTSLIPGYPIQLAILEPNETLDYEEIPLQRLADLHLLYPSITRENTSIEAQYFRNHYKTSNKVFPNQYAVRGFDLTFDTLLRLGQEGSFESTTASATQQVECQFNYQKNETAGYSNSGVYLLQVQPDLTVKQLN